MVVTDLDEIFRLATDQEAENRDFRRSLRAHHIPDNAFHIIASEVAAEVDCTECANCCRKTVVAITPSETETIANYLGMRPRDVSRLYTEPDPADSSQRVIRNSGDACVFLDGNLCTVYDARPKPCRDFPHIDLAERSLGARMETVCRRAAICPIVYNTLERFKQLVGWRRLRPDSSVESSRLS